MTTLWRVRPLLTRLTVTVPVRSYPGLERVVTLAVWAVLEALPLAGETLSHALASSATTAVQSRVAVKEMLSWPPAAEKLRDVVTPSSLAGPISSLGRLHPVMVSAASAIRVKILLNFILLGFCVCVQLQ